MSLGIVSLTVVLTVAPCLLFLDYGASMPTTDDDVPLPTMLRRLKRSTQLDPIFESAMAYYKKVHQESSCHVPQARVISVQHIHPSSELTYLTTCVVLHRCAHDSGCCSDTHACVPKESETVKIPVMATNVRKKDDLLTFTLSFTNHTMCHCQGKNHKDSNNVS